LIYIEFAGRYNRWRQWQKIFFTEAAAGISVLKLVSR